MKNLIKLTAPKNYTQKGQIVWINPDYVAAVYAIDQSTSILLNRGDVIFSIESLDTVVKLINDNAGH